MWKMRESALSLVHPRVPPIANPRSVPSGRVPCNGRRLFLEIFLADEICFGDVRWDRSAELNFLGGCLGWRQVVYGMSHD